MKLGFDAETRLEQCHTKLHWARPPFFYKNKTKEISYFVDKCYSSAMCSMKEEVTLSHWRIKETLVRREKKKSGTSYFCFSCINNANWGKLPFGELFLVIARPLQKLSDIDKSLLQWKTQWDKGKYFASLGKTLYLKATYRRDNDLCSWTPTSH